MKRTFRQLLLAVLLVLMAVPAFQASAQEQSIGEVESFTLDNGLTVLLAPRPGSAVTIFDIWVGVGSVNETPANGGISHFFEHMVFKGTDTRPGTVDLEIENLGGRTNASTLFDWTHYYITVPSENNLEALAILADIAQNANFPEDEIVVEKDVVLREMDQRYDNPGQFLSFMLYQEWYQTHPYGLPIIGTAESLTALTRQDFLDFLDTYYVPNNMVLVVVGDFEVEAMRDAVEAEFGEMAPRELPAETFPEEPPLTEAVVREIPRDFTQGYLAFAWPGPGIDDVDDVYAMDVLLAVLSFGRGSRFYQNIQRDLGIVTSINAGYFTLVDESIFSVTASFPYENRNLVEQAVFTELEKILNGELSEEELERAKTILVSQYVLNTESVAGLSNTLGFYATVAGDYEFALEYPEMIEDMTVDDLVETARAYIDLDRYLELVLVPENQEGAGPLEIGPEGVALDNGLQLILREDDRADVVGIQTFVDTGTVVESDEQAGIATLTQRLMLKGTTNRGEDELYEALENLGALIGQEVLPDMANISLVATGETLDEALPLYLDVLLNPAFRAEDLAQVKDEMIREIQAQQDNNFSVIYNNFLQTFYPDSGYGHPTLGTTETIQNISLEDVIDFYETYYVPNNMLVAAVGSFDAEQLYARLQGRLNSMAPSEADLAPPSFDVALNENQEVVADRNSNLTWLLLGFPGPQVSSEDYPAMKVLNTALGGGFTSRLFTRLRAEQGLAYQTGSAFPSRGQDSHLYTYIIALPENAEVATEGILDIVEEIKANGISEEELERAKNVVIGEYAIEHDTAVRRAWYLGWWEMLGAGAEMDEQYPELVRSVTSEDVQRVAETYLNNYVASLIGPTGGE